MDAFGRHAVPLGGAGSPADTERPPAPGFIGWVRVLLVGSSFALFGLGGFILSLAVLPVVWATAGARTRARRRCRRVVSASFRVFHGYMRMCRLVELEVAFADRRAEGPAVYVANHPTLVDVTAILSAAPDMACIVKPSIAYNPLFFLLIRLCGHVPVGLGPALSASVRTFAEAARRLEQGDAILVFPEGTRSPGARPEAFQRGAFELALRARVPIRPVLVTSHPWVLKKATPWYRFPRQMARLRVRFLPDHDAHLRASVRARALGETIRAILSEELGRCETSSP